MVQPPPYAPPGTDPAVGAPYPSAPPAPPPTGPAFYAPPAPVQSYAGGYAVGPPPPAGYQAVPYASAPGYPQGPVSMPYVQQAPSTRSCTVYCSMYRLVSYSIAFNAFPIRKFTSNGSCMYRSNAFAVFSFVFDEEKLIHTRNFDHKEGNPKDRNRANYGYNLRECTRSCTRTRTFEYSVTSALLASVVDAMSWPSPRADLLYSAC